MMTINQILQKVINKKITIYDAVNKIKIDPQPFLDDLRKSITNDSNYRLRLFSAWVLGEIKDKKSINILVRQYLQEKENNVRANIVRAIFFIDPSSLSLTMFKKLISDKYYPIPVMSVKFMAFNIKLHHKIKYIEIYNSTRNLLLKLEILRNIRFFVYRSKPTLEFLIKELKSKESQPLRSEIIEAIGLINSPDSLDYLLEYFNEKNAEFLVDPILADSLLKSIISLCQSKAYIILYKLYINHDIHIVKYKIIESLTIGGGPKSLQILNKIKEFEKDKYLLKFLIKQLKIIKITDF